MAMRMVVYLISLQAAKSNNTTAKVTTMETLLHGTKPTPDIPQKVTWKLSAV